MTKLKFFN
jgi:hypothetical protein